MKIIKILFPSIIIPKSFWIIIYEAQDWVKENAIVIDVGFNKLEDKSREQEYRLVGDVDFENVKNKVSYITPVPGGIGPMTIAMLMEQIVRAAELNMTLKL